MGELKTIEHGLSKNETLGEIQDSFKIPKEEIFKQYKGFEDFKKSIYLDPTYQKDTLLKILEKADEMELQFYFDSNLEDGHLININISNFINNFKGLIVTVEEKKDITKNPDQPVKIIDFDANVQETKNAFTNNKINKEEVIIKRNFDTSRKQEETLKEKLPQLRELFKNDTNIISILSGVENEFNNKNKIDEDFKNQKISEEDHFTKTGEIRENISKLLENYFLNKENATAFFNKLAEENPELYKQTYEAIVSLSPGLKTTFISWGIGSEPYKKVERLDGSKEVEYKSIIAQFPGAKGEDIEKRGDIVSYGDKSIDLKTGKAYISGDRGYAIETSMQVPNSLELRVRYQKERLEILDEIKTNEKILGLLENKENLKQKLEGLNKQKGSSEKNAADLQLDIEINAIQKELQMIDKNLKQAVPGYSEEQDKNLKVFLEEKIKESKQKLTSLQESFNADMQKLLEAGKDKIQARDEKVRETISFLDDLGITNINQSDLQKIINRVNIHPQAYGFSKPIDLKKGFEGSATDALKQKKEFFHFFSKIYEKMNFDPPVNDSVVQGLTKDPRLKNDTTFKQKLEDAGVTLGGALQIETFFTFINEKQENKDSKTHKN